MNPSMHMALSCIHLTAVRSMEAELPFSCSLLTRKEAMKRGHDVVEQVVAACGKRPGRAPTRLPLGPGACSPLAATQNCVCAPSRSASASKSACFRSTRRCAKPSTRKSASQTRRCCSTSRSVRPFHRMSFFLILSPLASTRWRMPGAGLRWSVTSSLFETVISARSSSCACPHRTVAKVAWSLHC